MKMLLNEHQRDLSDRSDDGARLLDFVARNTTRQYRGKDVRVLNETTGKGPPCSRTSVSSEPKAHARYKMSFESDDGTITGKVNVALPEGDDERPPYEKRQAAVEKMKVLAAALCREIEKLEA
jgi:hypothetical protein